MPNREESENPSGNQYLAEQKSCPPVLYKYCSIATAERIFQSGLRLSSVTSFNDPFDSRFVAKWPSDEDVIRRVKEIAQKEGWSADITSARIEEALRRKREYPDGNTPERREMAEKQGISCFSEVRDSILMWGHYADKHKGVCIGVRFQAMSDSFRLAGFRHVTPKVNYSDAFPEWTVGTDNERENVLKAMTTKASCWKYEQEWRVMATDGVGKHLRIPAGCVPCVIFGAKTSKEDEIRLLASVYGNGYEPELLKAKVSERKYELEISPMRVDSYFRVPRPREA